MTISFNKEAETLLRRTLEKAGESALTTRGGHMRFPVSPGQPIVERVLQDYCAHWMDPVIPTSKIESGWRPRIVADDNTVIYIVSNDAVNCQGRVETVQAIAVIAAGLVCRIPPDIAMACPSAAAFWDWTEKKGITSSVKKPRPPSTLLPYVESGKSKGDSLKDFSVPSCKSTSITSRCITEYKGVIVDEKARVMMEERAKPLEEVDMKYVRPPTMDEAEKLMNDSLRIVMEEMERNNMYVGTTMQHPYTISVGQMIAYCKKIVKESEVYHLGTRWRPARLCHLLSSRKKEIRGGLMLQNGIICVDGSVAMSRGLAPVVAALRIRLDPEIAKKTNAFDDFFTFIDHDRQNFIPSVSSVVSDWEPPASVGRREEDDEDFYSNRFAQEENMMKIVMQYLRSEYVRSLGQFQGSEAFKPIQWSQEDFVHNLLLWWPEAEIQNAGHFRYVPNGLEKGGLRWFEPGSYFSAQGRAAWQGGFMPMIASLVCGIPAEIAALLKASDLFWSHIYTESGSVSKVQYHRDRIRRIRDQKYEWNKDNSERSNNNQSWNWTSTREHNWNGGTNNKTAAVHDAGTNSKSGTANCDWNRGNNRKSTSAREDWNGGTNNKTATVNNDWNSGTNKKSTTAEDDWNGGTNSKTGTANCDWNRGNNRNSTTAKDDWNSGTNSKSTTGNDDWYRVTNRNSTAANDDCNYGSNIKTSTTKYDWNGDSYSKTCTANDEWNEGPGPEFLNGKSDSLNARTNRNESPQVEWNQEYFKENMKSFDEICIEIFRHRKSEIIKESFKTVFDVSDYLCEVGKAIAGSAAPQWSLINTQEFLVCICPKQECELRINLKSAGGGSVWLVGTGSDGMIEMLAAICCGVPPLEVPGKCKYLTEWMIKTFLPSDLSREELEFRFSSTELDKVIPKPIENRPPKEGNIVWETRHKVWIANNSSSGGGIWVNR